MTTAFVLSGGASLGAIQVGMLQALGDAGIEPDLWVGTSVGAVNAAFMSGHPGPEAADRLADLWRGIRRATIFPARPLTGLLGFAGRQPNLVSPRPLRALMRANLTFARLEEAPVPIHAIAVDVVTGRDVRLSSGPALESIMASAAIPGVYPPVTIDGVAYMDGGVVNNAPISHAVALGADTIWVLPAGYAGSLPKPPRSALGMALHGLTVLVQRRLYDDVALYRDRADLRVAPPLDGVMNSPADFSHTADLMARARASTRAWIEAGATTDPERPPPAQHKTDHLRTE